jgi:hypothetical protein
MDPEYAGLPSMISETTWTRPNRYRSEAPLYYAAFGALQDGDAIVHFSFDALTPLPARPRFNRRRARPRPARSRPSPRPGGHAAPARRRPRRTPDRRRTGESRPTLNTRRHGSADTLRRPDQGRLCHRLHARRPPRIVRPHPARRARRAPPRAKSPPALQVMSEDGPPVSPRPPTPPASNASCRSAAIPGRCETSTAASSSNPPSARNASPRSPAPAASAMRSRSKTTRSSSNPPRSTTSSSADPDRHFAFSASGGGAHSCLNRSAGGKSTFLRRTSFSRSSPSARRPFSPS